METSVFDMWRPILSKPGYSASSRGEIIGPRGIVKKQTFDRYGYPRVTLYRNRRAIVASLVCEAFHGPRPVGYECRHLNGDKTDSSPSNLKWGTVKENAADKVRLAEMPRGEAHGMSKLKGEHIGIIRRLAGSLSQQKIADRFGVSQVAISRILLGRSWAHV